LACCLLFCITNAAAQIEIAGINVTDGERHIQIQVKAMNGNEVMPQKDLLDRLLDRKGTIKITEQRAGEEEKPLRFLRDKFIRDAVKSIKTEGKKDTFRIILLLDVGNAMDDAALAEGKNLIREIVQKLTLSAHSIVWFSTFGDDCMAPQPIHKGNVEDLLSGVKLSDQNPDLFYCVNSAFTKLEDSPGKKVMFILSNGKNNTAGISRYSVEIRLTEDMVVDRIPSDNPRFAIFPIALGKAPETGLFEKLTARTQNQLDAVQTGQLPKNLDDIIEGDSVILYTHIISGPSHYPVFRGEPMTYRLFDKSNKLVDTLMLSRNVLGNPNNPRILKSMELVDWLLLVLLGLGILITALAIFSFAIPVWQRAQFRKHYVQPYQPEPGRRRTDPLTKLPIEAGELVVNKCSQIIPLATWEGLNWQCPNYPECMQIAQMQCKGEGAPESTHNFFSLQGVFRRLNWLWFGAVGGFLGWLVFALFKIFDFGWYKNWLKTIYQAYANIVSGGDAVPDLNAFADNALIGIAFGFGLTSMLAFVEERGQARKISWLRIAMRILLGTLLSGLVFMAGFFLQYEQLIPNAFLAGLLTWLLFGLTLGFVLSFKSSISYRQGLPGGMAAALLGYFIYTGIATFTDDYHLAKLISLLTQGAVLGWVLVTVTTRLEDFELEFIAPRKYQRIVPISKWLKSKSNLEVVIGTEQGAYVYIGWADPNVQTRHAELHYDKGIVSIEAFGETLVRGVLAPLHKKIPLNSGDVIQLGRNGQTVLQFKEKTASKSRPKDGKPKPDAPPADGDKGRLNLRFDKK